MSEPRNDDIDGDADGNGDRDGDGDSDGDGDVDVAPTKTNDERFERTKFPSNCQAPPLDVWTDTAGASPFGHLRGWWGDAR